MLCWNFLPNDQGRTTVSRNYTYIHRNLHACARTLSTVLVLPLGEQDKEKKGFLVHLPIHIHKIALVADSLPLVFLADLLSIKSQLVRKFPTKKAILWNQNNALKNTRVNKLWTYHKPRIFLALFPATWPGSYFRSRITKVCRPGEVCWGPTAWSLLLQSQKGLLWGSSSRLPRQPWMFWLQPKWVGCPSIPLMLGKYPCYPQLPQKNTS